MSLGAPKEQYAQAASGTAIVGTTETVICTLTGIDTTGGGDTVQLQGFLWVTTGAGTTSYTVRIRRGTTITAPGVGPGPSHPVGASVNDQVEIQVEDTPGEMASGSYVLTVQQLGATGNGTVQSASLRAVY